MGKLSYINVDCHRIGTSNNNSYPGGRGWKYIFDHPGWVHKQMEITIILILTWKIMHKLYTETVNTWRLRQNGRHFADVFNCIFLNEDIWISLKISLKFVRKVRINHIPTLVQIMAWRLPGDKLLSEPMMVSLLTNICVTRPQWIKDLVWYIG